MINRAALLVRPKKSFLDWATGLDDSGLLPEVEGDRTVYLIPDYFDDAGAQAILKTIYLEVFENELVSWHTDAFGLCS
jgi:hypothetical protein